MRYGDPEISTTRKKAVRLVDNKRATLLMEKKNLDILVGTGFVNYGYITGYFSHFGQDYPGPLVDGTPVIRFAGLPRERSLSPFLIAPIDETSDIEVQGTWIEDRLHYGTTESNDPVLCFYRAMKERDLLKSKVGLDMQNVSVVLMKELKKRLPHTKFVDAHDDFLTLRMIKTPEEIERLRGAVKGAERGHKAVRESLREGMTSSELASIVKRAIIDKETDSYIVHTCIGKEGAVIDVPSETRIKRGNLVAVDVTSWFKYYAGDMFRVYSFGKPRNDAVRMHEALDKLNSEVIEAIRPGVKASGLCKIAKETMKDLGLPLNSWGWGDGKFVGHGIGLDIHEPPYLNMNSDTALQPNMLIVAEIALRSFEIGAFCAEETVLVTPSGHELLSSIPRTLTIIE